MTAVAAVDCGTNSLRLLIADLDADGNLVERERRTEIVRLGQGVDATGEFHPDALRRTFAVVEAYAERIEAAGVPVDRIHFVATSAARDARNREEFFTGVLDRLGVMPDVISGDREARLSFAGALSGVRVTAEPVLVMDIGGGSTELIVGSAVGTMASAVSLDIGSVRMTERFLKAGPPTPAAVAPRPRTSTTLLDRSGIDFSSIQTWIGVAAPPPPWAACSSGCPSTTAPGSTGCCSPPTRRALLEARSMSIEGDRVSQCPAGPSVTGGALIASRVGVRDSGSGMVVSEPTSWTGRVE
jgi:exopolyphosphatase/guanosine-5'-triphosphate,3'-diphosphate pyrophosphatase